MHDDMWNNRFSGEEYVYGTEPNLFFKEQLDKLIPGRLILPAEGEGRNAVYAALKGWQITAFDTSTEGRKKALKLADRNNVSIDYFLASFENVSLEQNFYDAIGIIFVHLPDSIKENTFSRFLSFLKPGGRLIMECFSKEQLNYNSGGPKEESRLYSEEEIRHFLSDLKDVEITKEIVELHEGEFHKGLASVIKATGIK